MQTRDSIEDLDAPSEVALDEALSTRSQPNELSPPPSVKEEPPEPAPRESIVPRGTFASDEPAALDEAAPVDDAPKRPSDPGSRSAPLQPIATGGGVVVGDPQASQEPRVAAPAQPAVRPPFLASEILREDLMPAEPGREAMTLTLRVFAALGLLAAIWSYASTPFALASVGSLSLLAASALRVPHLTRAIMVATIAGAGLTIACAWRMALGGGAEDALLAVSTSLLASALFFRAWYRGSSAARVLVAASLLCCASWALMTANSKLLSLDWTVQSWLPALTWCVFVILCVLSLLAFMDDETTGACDIWATILLGWYVVEAVSHEALRGEMHGAEDGMGALGLTEPVFAGPLAVALAQLLARALGRQQRLTQVLLRRNA